MKKKFTRKRKKTEERTEEMVIVPRDYSAHPLARDIVYKQYFVYWKSWNQELVSGLTDQVSHKKLLECVEQAAMNLKKMATLLNDAEAQKLSVYVHKTEDLKAKILEARAMPPSQLTNLRYDAERILSGVNREFDVRKMKNCLRP